MNAWLVAFLLGVAGPALSAGQEWAEVCEPADARTPALLSLCRRVQRGSAASRLATMRTDRARWVLESHRFNELCPDAAQGSEGCPAFDAYQAQLPGWRK